MIKGLIALDIDGTITVEHHTLPAAVVQYMSTLVKSGWGLVFITGRTFGWGYEVLKSLPFQYYFAVQNGAIILEMPSRRVVARRYLDRSVIPKMNEVCRDEPSDFVVYAGFEHDDICYFRPKRFSSELSSYLERRVNTLKEKWCPVETFEEMPIDAFASVKCFGSHSSALRLVEKIEQQVGLHVPLIRDPFDESYFVAQATHPEISKGRALQDLMGITGHLGAVIAAGDDRNDRSMLDVAHIKVVMETAPEEILQLADIVAPTAAEEGIIKGLEDALKLYREKFETRRE